MAILRDIRRRIVSVRNTRQITAAMRMVSAAKLNRAQSAVRMARPYANALFQVVTNLSRGMTGEDHPFFRANRPGGKTVIVLFTSDRGLCGGFNGNLNKSVFRQIRDGTLPDPEMICFGRTGNDFFRRRNIPIRRSIVYARPVEKEAAILEIIEDVTARYLTGEVGRLYIAYNHYHNPVRQDPTVHAVVPLPEPPPERRHTFRIDTIFEPSRAEILGVMLQRFLQNQLFQAHLNTEAGEHGARMAAMEGATKNAGKMIDSLTLQYNRARQANITKELIEIVNGAQSL
jgi:F-type H+-transporting ATPase subunit gamma